MDIRTKYLLIEKLVKTEDEAILDQVKAILGEGEQDFWEELGQSTQESILRGKEEARRGEVRSHEEVMKDIKKRFLK